MTASQAPTPELLALHRRYGKSRCTKLRNRLVEAHLNLVRQQAARFAKASSVCFDDLFQEGCFGLCDAVQRYQPQRGYAFSTYAVTLIRGQMQHYLRDRHHLIRSPWRLRQLLSRSDQLQQKRQQAGLPPLNQQAQARSLGCRVERLQMALQLRQALNLRSFDAAPEGTAFEPTDQRPTPEARLAEAEIEEWLEQQTAEDQILLRGVMHERRSQRQLARQLGWPPCRVNRRLQQLRQLVLLQFSATPPSRPRRQGPSSRHSPPHC